MLGDSVDSAVESLLSEMAMTRSYAVGAGKTDLLEAFALVGPDDSRVPGWRRRLAALVH
jgi:thioredoxin-like negative regulator of GroEL